MKRVLTPGGPDRLRFHPPGYLLTAAPEELDVERFSRLVDEGRRLLAEGASERARRAARGARALARSGAAGRGRARRRGGPAGGVPARRAGRSDRRRPRNGPASGTGGRVGTPGGRRTAARTTTRAADAGAVPVRPAGRRTLSQYSATFGRSWSRSSGSNLGSRCGGSINRSSLATRRSSSARPSIWVRPGRRPNFPRPPTI